MIRYDKISNDLTKILEDFGCELLLRYKGLFEKTVGDEKQSGTPNNASQSPKESAFQALGFPSKMSYEHRSKLRK